MAKALLIAEKPSLMLEVKKVYNKNKSKFKDEIDFQTFAGHTMSLKMPGELNPAWEKWSLSTLPIIPDNLDYKVDPSKKKMYNEIKKQIKQGGYDYLINCCDPGREGQAIFHTFYRSLNCKLPVKRMWHLDLTEEKLMDALLNLRDDLNEPALYNMTEASILRAKFDWLIGMNYSPAYTLRANAGKAIGVGRVMTPTLAIIVNRELEIQNFVPQDYYQIEADFGDFSGTYFNVVDKKENTRLDTMEDVEKILKSLSLNPNDSKVIATDKKKSLKYAPALHNLSSMQAEASRAFGYTPKKTLELVQSLYEKKLVSYPRTNSEHLTKAMTKDFNRMLACLRAVPDLGEHVDKVLSEPKRLTAVASNKSYVDDSKVTDHYAITPTGNTADLSKLSIDEGNIYTLVAKRFLSIFMDPQATERSVIVTENNSHKFKTNGTILLDKGYTVLYGTTVNNKMLPDLSKGDSVTLLNTTTTSKKTSPPSRYSDASLIETMVDVAKLVEDKNLKDVMREAKGIGTEATRADIIEKLVKNKYIIRKGKGKTQQIHATEYGISIIEGLRGQEIILPELTAEWESKLANIEKCIYDPKDFYNEMIKYIETKTKEMMKMTVKIEGASTNNKKVVGKCPKCEEHRDVIEGTKGYGCSGYKEGCDFVIWKNQFGGEISRKNAELLLKGEATEPITFHSKAKNTNYTAKLKLKEDYTTELVFSTTVVGKCPCCGKDIIESAKLFKCAGEKENNCDFKIWKEVAGAKITEKDAKALITGKATESKTFTKKDKSGTFNATLILKDNKVVFNF